MYSRGLKVQIEFHVFVAVGKAEGLFTLLGWAGYLEKLNCFKFEIGEDDDDGGDENREDDDGTDVKSSGK